MTLAHPFDELRVGRFEAHGVAWINYERCGDWMIGKIDLKHLYDESGEDLHPKTGPLLTSIIIAELAFSREHSISLSVLDALRGEDRAADRGCEECHWSRGAE